MWSMEASHRPMNSDGSPDCPNYVRTLPSNNRKLVPRKFASLFTPTAHEMKRTCITAGSDTQE